MKKKLCAYFHNEDEAFAAVMKLRDAQVDVISVEEVIEESDYVQFLSSIGSVSGYLPFALNVEYPFDTYEAPFTRLDENGSYPFLFGYNDKTKVKVRFDVAKKNMTEALKIITEYNGKI